MNNLELKKLIREEIRKIIIETEIQSNDKLQKNIDMALKAIKNSSLRAKVESLVKDPSAMKSLKNNAMRAAFLTAMATAAGITPDQFTTTSSLVKKNLKQS